MKIFHAYALMHNVRTKDIGYFTNKETMEKAVKAFREKEEVMGCSIMFLTHKIDGKVTICIEIEEIDVITD